MTPLQQAAATTAVALGESLTTGHLLQQPAQCYNVSPPKFSPHISTQESSNPFHGGRCVINSIHYLKCGQRPPDRAGFPMKGKTPNPVRITMGILIKSLQPHECIIYEYKEVSGYKYIFHIHLFLSRNRSSVFSTFIIHSENN